MNWLKKFLQKYCCEHEYKWVRNIYGDEINILNYRSIWKCVKCDKYEYRDYIKPEGKSFIKLLDKKYDEFYLNKFLYWQEIHVKEIDDIKAKLIDAAERGLCWLDIMLHIDEDNDDRWNWDKTFEELGIEYTRELPSSEVYRYDIEYHLSWNN